MPLAGLAVLVGLLVGVVVGALGAGGGILSVPALVYLLHQDPHSAAAGSLVIVAITALVSMPNRARLKQIDWQRGVVFGAISTAGSLAGAKLSALASAYLLLSLFALMLFIMGTLMLAKGLKQVRTEKFQQFSQIKFSSAPLYSPSSSSQIRKQQSWLAVICAALGTGLLTGFFGVGGGFMVVPILTLVLGFAMRMASGTSLLIIVIASLAALVGRIGQPLNMDWLVVSLFAGGSMAGGLIGGPLSQKIPPAYLTLIFGLLLLAVGGFTGFNTWI